MGPEDEALTEQQISRHNQDKSIGLRAVLRNKDR